MLDGGDEVELEENGEKSLFVGDAWFGVIKIDGLQSKEFRVEIWISDFPLMSGSNGHWKGTLFSLRELWTWRFCAM